ncbi:MAG: hypothetical protein A2787_00180 [Omnitrophica WOR_2 bacterium RIFCSPHIGHO2_01_FULL_48_9]|nr:MAG: hypothetical protein A2787_00180 [Omnitrophica WOR_2 bacterium RIFCSPHIGHO2_01_FULL_48_9]
MKFFSEKIPIGLNMLLEKLELMSSRLSKLKKNSVRTDFFSASKKYFFVAVFVTLALTLMLSSVAVSAEPQSRRVAVVLFNFQNDNSQPYTADYARNMVFGTISSYYNEISYGKLSLEGDVFGWYTIPYPSTSCQYTGWANAADAKVAESGTSLAGYDNVIYVFPRTTACGWTGLGQVGGKRLWDNGRLTLGIVGHEFGHNLGIDHSNTLRCYNNGVTVSMSGDCKEVGYTDPYDIMGSGTFSTNYAAHMSMFHKGAMGWLEASNTKTVTASGTYTIEANEVQTAGVQSLRIPITDGKYAGKYYYIEFRQPYGFDDYFRFRDTPASKGVSIRIAPDYARFTQTFMIDTTPETLSFEDAPLLVGRTFSDGKISITPLAINGRS